MEATVTDTALTNDHLRLSLRRDGEAVDGYSLDVQHDGSWISLGIGRFGRLVYKDTAGERQESVIRYTEVEADDREIRLSAEWADGDGVVWSLQQRFELLPDARQVLAACSATPAEGRQVLHWSGPTLLVGEGSFGASKTDAIFPGLEYLLDDEPSSSTAFAAEKYAARYVPHPYKITVPLMAVSHDGVAVGLMWDPNQAYGSAWRHPAAVFASPNRLEGGENHLLGLFAPGIPRFLAENTFEAHRPIGAGPDRPLTLEARIVALADATAIDLFKIWVETYGLPELAAPHGYEENVELCVRSYVDVAWDEASEGWHHTLADPWPPRYEHRLIAQLWRYGQWPAGDPALRARAREQVRRGVAKALTLEEAKPELVHGLAVPHLELALHYGLLTKSLEASRRQAQALIESQDADGSWHWQPELMASHSLATDERKQVMGGGDSATGLTADRARYILAWARISGDDAAREAGMRAVTWCNAQRRPEGAQTWELHLHVPDILAAPYLIDINLEAYAATGDPNYLAQADRWAWTGLPFTYLWKAYFRPIMAYGTVPSFGVTFHDAQPWFGVDVHWNGLVYADALLRLAAATGNPLWRQLAKGLIAGGIQQQATSGPWLGMYPDAFSPVTGDEEYTWWLNPNLIGLNTFELAGIPLDVETTTVARNGSTPLRVTSGAKVVEARSANGSLSLLLDYPAGEPSQTIVAGLTPPVGVRIEGSDVSRVDDLDGRDRGWTWLEEFQALVVKAPHTAGGTVNVEVDLA